jgi:hypothetical protein
MYHPADRTDGRNVEFIEIYNSNPFFEDLSGYRISGGINYTFPDGTILQGQSYLVVAPVPADVTAVYGIGGVLGKYSTTQYKILARIIIFSLIRIFHLCSNLYFPNSENFQINSLRY